MRERLDTLGGTLAISSQLGRTSITASVPLPLAAPNLQGHTDER
jgi:two-component system NarL family sensor kinase